MLKSVKFNENFKKIPQFPDQNALDQKQKSPISFVHFSGRPIWIKYKFISKAQRSFKKKG